MKLSVVLCTRNGQTYLGEQLTSLQGQTHLPDELLICDDVSTDDTPTIIADFARTAKFPVRVIYNPVNLGSTANFAQAIQHSTGDIIALCDQDDIWLPEKLATIYACLQDNPQIDGVFSDAVVVSAEGQPKGYQVWQVNRFNARQQARFEHGQAIQVLLKRNVITGATLAFRAKWRDKILPIASSWIHDGWIGFILASYGHLHPIAQPLIHYRQHNKNQLGANQVNLHQAIQRTSTYPAERYQHMARQYEDLLAHLTQLGGLDDEILRQIQAKITHMHQRTNLLSAKRFSRIHEASIELASGRYHRYSAGWSSFIRDILFD
jgi:glycosyltransferase involved in cell wall biosynthesis